ncbi:hypothetical protein C2I36_09680 [Rhodobacteraceae bacterium WD3A24]|nr:hypothetical protein C2I36_09680 [Rhodobacteraceae bacterium WD3A24]
MTGGLLRAGLLALLTLAAAACTAPAADEWDSAEQVRRAAHAPDGPPRVTLYTMVSTTNGRGEHAALLIDGAQRILFDPAGTWFHRTAPRRHDVHYGMRPALLDLYLDYHARETFDVNVHELDVSAQTAARLIAAAEGHPPVRNAFCARSISTILRQDPALAPYVDTTFFPNRLAEDFTRIPGVRVSVISDDSAHDNGATLAAQQRALDGAPAQAVR